MLTEEQKRGIVARISERAPNIVCPMCRNNTFTLADGYTRNQLQAKIGELSLGGLGIPSIAIICNRCGFISQHALGTLGLLPATTEAKPAATVAAEAKSE